MKMLGEKEAANLGGFEAIIKNRMLRINDTYTRMYYVLADNLNQKEEDVVQCFGVPQKGSMRGRAVCMNHRAKELARVRHPMTGLSSTLWEVEAEFDSEFAADMEEAATPPEDRRAKRRWYGETEEEELEADAITGEPIETKAGEPIICMVPIIVPILEVTRWMLGEFDPDMMVNYCNHTNSVAFYGAPKGCALLMPIETEEDRDDDDRLITQLVFKIKFKIKKKTTGETTELLEDTWAYKPLHIGQQYNVQFGSEPIQVKRKVDEDQNPIFIKLDADGFPLAADAEPVYLKFNRFQRANFADLNIDPTPP